jgi:hypothetical protein
LGDKPLIFEVVLSHYPTTPMNALHGLTPTASRNPVAFVMKAHHNFPSGRSQLT